jgi:hypothetical protein
MSVLVDGGVLTFEHGTPISSLSLHNNIVFQYRLRSAMIPIVIKAGISDIEGRPLSSSSSTSGLVTVMIRESVDTKPSLSVRRRTAV